MEVHPKEHGTKKDRELGETLGQATESLFDVGRLWAAHGLNVGRSALEASAQTLRTTAEVLGALSDRFAKDREEEERPDAA